MIKKILYDILNTYDLNQIEKHVFYTYLINNNIKHEKSALLTTYLNDFELLPKLYFDLGTLEIKNIKELENYLELIVPEGDRKYNGAFFTPNFVIDFIINKIQPKETDKNLDPSCGCGAFLIGLIEFLKNAYKKPINAIIKENIFGSDILEYNIKRTKLLLTIYALENGEALDEKDFNLWHQDSLRTKWSMQFENILGNPPYVKFQDLSNENREYLIKEWKTVEGGTFNLYFAFFELGYKLLSEGGKLGYITPNNYFTSLSGESLRRYFQLNKCVTDIVDFSHKKVFDVQTYTAITFIGKKQSDTIIYDRIKENQSPEVFLKNTNGSINCLKNLNAKKWRLLKKDEQENIQTIETIGVPLNKLYDICAGIATLKDDIYFLEGNYENEDYYEKTTDKGIFEIEKNVTKSVYKISDFKSQSAALKNSRRIIFPYKLKNGIATPIVENEFKINFPKCYEYLLSEKQQLLARDKGKIKYEPFYLWGRTQGLTKRGKKILTPTFSRKPRFLLINEEDAYYTNGYGLFFKDVSNVSTFFDDNKNQMTSIENIDVLQKILNSLVMDYYVSKTSVSIEGGYPCYQKNFIENFTIPEFSENELNSLRNLTNSKDIDDFLIEKYQIKLFAGNLAW